MKKHTVGTYILLFEEHVKHETYECESYHGIIFHDNDIKYDVLHNYVLGQRIIISNKHGLCQDIPFKKETFYLLPNTIKVEEI